MGGGLLQLVAYGAQDAYITGNPQITFWKGLFKRHTNFAMEPFRINFSGQIQWGTKQTALVGRHADLLYSTYVEVTLPLLTSKNDQYYWNNEQGQLGYNLIKYVELDVGGQIIDRLYSEFMVIWGKLTQDSTQSGKLTDLLSGPCLATGPSRLTYGADCGTDGRQQKPNVIYIPLPFFFTRNPGAALPLIALQYHEVKINVLWNEPQFIAGNFTKDAVTLGSGTTTDVLPPIQDLPQAIQASLYIDYIYLDTEERRRMAQASHEYLIEQTQFNEDKGIVGANSRIDLTFNHPVKELIWVVQPSEYTDCRFASANDEGGAVTSVSESSSTNHTGTDATFHVNWIGGAYTVRLASPGSGYSSSPASVLTFTGSKFGGTTANNLTITVTSVNASGGILTFTFTGTAPSTIPTRLRPFTYSSDPVFDQWLQINGQDRLDRRYGDYYNKVQAYQHHSGTPVGPGVYMYSFAIRPEEHQPSGTCNFSRIDTATIVMNMASLGSSTLNNPGLGDGQNWNVRVYAINYNVLRVMSGMGGLAYSN